MKKPISILFSLLLLLSTTGLTYGQHFCEGVVVDKSFTIGFETMNCAGVEGDDACENNPKENDCCSDTYYQLQTDKEFSGKYPYTSLDIPTTVAAQTNFLVEVVALSKKQRPFTLYTPPDRVPNKLALYQTYLI